MKLTKRHCMLCEIEGREQIGGVFIVACKQYDCCNVIADETEADVYVAQLEADLERYDKGEVMHRNTAKMIEDLRTENARFQDALRKIASRTPGNWRQKIAIEALGSKPEKCYTLKEIKDMFFPNRDLDSLRSEIGVSPDQCPAPD